MRDEALGATLKERKKAFVNYQLMRDPELIKIMEVKEKEMEKNMLQNVEAFGYLYKEYQKEIKAFIDKRNEEFEQSLSYRDKLWTDSIY